MKRPDPSCRIPLVGSCSWLCGRTLAQERGKGWVAKSQELGIGTLGVALVAGLLAVGMLAAPELVRADEGEGIRVVVDLDKGKVTPEQPTVNGWLPDAAVFMEVTGQKGKVIHAYPDVAQYTRFCKKGTVSGQPTLEDCDGRWVLKLVDSPGSRPGRQTTMRVASCSDRAFKKHGFSGGESAQCPLVVFRDGVPESSPSWTLFSDAGVVVWTFDIYDPSKPGSIIEDKTVPCIQPPKSAVKNCVTPVIKDGKAVLVPCARLDPECVGGKRPKREERGEYVSSYSVPVHIARKPFALRWSAGFGFPNVSNERYRLEPIAADSGTSDMASIIRVSDEENPYQLAAYAHWVPLAADSFAISIGLSTDVPVEDLSIMLGASLHLRTLPIKNGVFLTAGVAYVLEDHLRPAFEGVGLVPASLKAEDLVEGEAEFKLFFGLSFGFWGGEKKFSGVVSGGK